MLFVNRCYAIAVNKLNLGRQRFLILRGGQFMQLRLIIRRHDVRIQTVALNRNTGLSCISGCFRPEAVTRNTEFLFVN